MTKSELIESIARSQKHLPAKDVELAVKHILELMSEALAQKCCNVRCDGCHVRSPVKKCSALTAMSRTSSGVACRYQ